ncbi:ABC transporter ATP-binding protein [Erysipelothrix inopinata]|uniref:ABC transporter ATP-binding protein n=1 Tax=Erysipelothrix inopinata TaxID=225084 RepID=A0A7G9S197_9FIRM|nr:ABC transporter ATP-binding protein [Erysipelothrix inopinata]QNN61622.1 ABC transporter ATP-binding protein [Erysipelothrix inopinata]
MKQQETKKFQGLTNLLSYSKRYKGSLITVGVLALTGAIFILLGPKQIETITNLIIEGMHTGIDLERISKVGMTLVIIYIIGFGINYAKQFIMASITQRLNNQLRTEIDQKINRLPLSYFDEVSYGDVLSRVTNDVDTIGKTLNNSIPTIVTSITLLVGSLFMMVTSNLTLAIIIVTITLLGFTMVKLITKKSQPYFNKQQQVLGDMSGFVEEAYTGHTIIKVYNASDDINDEFSEINDKLTNYGKKAHFLSGIMTPLISFIGNLSYVAVAIVGSKMVVSGSIEFGVVVAFTMYIRQFNNPLSQLTQVVTDLQTASAASIRVRDFMNEDEIPTDTNSPEILDHVEGNINFDHVSFGYDPNKPIIKDFSCDVVAGQKIAIVGPTGAGKTTLVNLLMRFYDVTSGDIKIDGTSIFNITKENLRNQFGMVLQDTWIFEGTVYENLVYSIPNINIDTVEKACERVGIDHFINSLPNGYDTVLDETTSLSEGQKQQFTIVRAMLKNAPLLILDEATSSIDTRTELIIQNAMDELMKGRTSFVIAHRLSTIKDADLILVMKDGNVIESGTHDELLEQRTFYYNLYNSQFQTA